MVFGVEVVECEVVGEFFVGVVESEWWVFFFCFVQVCVFVEEFSCSWSEGAEFVEEVFVDVEDVCFSMEFV